MRIMSAIAGTFPVGMRNSKLQPMKRILALHATFPRGVLASEVIRTKVAADNRQLAPFACNKLVFNMDL